MKKIILGILAVFSWAVAGIWLADVFIKDRISYGLAQLIISVLFIIMIVFILYLGSLNGKSSS